MSMRLAGVLCAVAAACASVPAAGADPSLAAMQKSLLEAPDAARAALIADRLEAARQAALSPTTRLMLHRGQRELAAGELRASLDDLSDAVELQPDQALLWRERAAVRAMQGDQDGAIQDLGGALNRDPGDVAAWSSLSVIEEHHGDAAAAYAAWEHVLRLDPVIGGGASRLDHLRHQMVGDPT
ncbi:hypothetical protein HN018_08335 [Lichenicola cladoniae]|uniref:Uncharacterized protein n=1 Tax=Lichenicola cladoniae TaxID=1484109 RepID=A0A6M8HP46_9PROT|nr:hypothetical protein [Lichenicola cladoniae]NPD68463.1 hypothetical protein [Acetobacteraceae bacterium]QKE90057.1 hypothetical protein HN018_08335 [Lichenicola cladoniae]